MGLRGPKPKTLEERFFPKLSQPKENGCIEWTAGAHRSGYGVFHLDPANGNRKVYAHRWSYEYHVGPIPVGASMDHLCRNTLCVNPDHLEPVTQKENVLRGESFAAKNAKKTHCPIGHPLDGGNLYVNPNTGARACRACCRERDRRRRPRGRKKD